MVMFSIMRASNPNRRFFAKKPMFVKVSLQGSNECGHYTLKYAGTYDGEKIIENIHNNGVGSSSAFNFCVWLIVYSFSMCHDF